MLREMKEKLQKLVLLILECAFFFACSSICVCAETPTIVPTIDASLKAGEWTPASASLGYDKPTYYKIKISKRGYIKLDIESQYAYAKINYILCNSKKKKLKMVNGSTSYSSEKKEDYIAVEKGTYYIAVSGDDNAEYRIRYTFYVNPNKLSYTKKKAISLKRGKTVHPVFYTKDKKKTYQSWYKIKVPTKKWLKVELKAELGGVRYINDLSIYDQKGNAIPTFMDENIYYYTERKVKAGIYYLCVRWGGWHIMEKKRTEGICMELKWM